jgi:hypothetical protein
MKGRRRTQPRSSTSRHHRPAGAANSLMRTSFEVPDWSQAPRHSWPTGRLHVAVPAMAHIFGRAAQVWCEGGSASSANPKATVDVTFSPTFIVASGCSRRSTTPPRRGADTGRGKIFDRAVDVAIATVGRSTPVAVGAPAAPARDFRSARLRRLRAASVDVQYAVSGAPVWGRLGHFFAGIGLLSWRAMA